jgi:hypothetical protein
VNECYEGAFPHLPKYPKFSFARAMITLWKCYTYRGLHHILLAAFQELLRAEREPILQQGKLLTQQITYKSPYPRPSPQHDSQPTSAFSSTPTSPATGHLYVPGELKSPLPLPLPLPSPSQPMGHDPLEGGELSTDTPIRQLLAK